MTRFLDDLLLFLLPFVLFAIYLLIRRRNLLHWASWSGQVSWLTIAGLGLMILALLFTYMTAERHQGQFVPTHVENGRVVPGQFR